MADDNDGKRSGPVLQLLASGLQFWIRQQCQAVDSLEIQLHGSAFGLLRGRLEGVSLVARRVIFSDLEIELVDLRSDAIQVQIGLADGLLGLSPLQELRIERDRLLLWAEGLHCETEPRARDGRIELVHCDTGLCVPLPADPNIQIDVAELSGGLLQLRGSARVSP